MYMEDEKWLQEFDNFADPLIFDASLLPPAHPTTDVDDAPPSWVLLDILTYIADCSDADAAATTAKSTTRGGHAIEVTLCAARPPLVSHLCIHCPGLKPTRFATEPRIIAAEDGLILLSVVIGHQSLGHEPKMFDYFIYQPATRELKLLPHPPAGQFGFFLRHAALLRCFNPPSGDGKFTLRHHGPARGDYIIAILEKSQEAYELHRFRSETDSWTKIKLQLGAMNPSPGLSYFFHTTDKVITLGGGGFMGWVDLWRGILLCNMLIDDPELIYVPLPSPPTHFLDTYEAIIVRDIAVVDQRYIKYVDQRYDSRYDWTATTWSKKIADPWDQDWHKDCELRASDIVSALPPLPKPLQMLITSHPAISLQGDDVIYMTKVTPRDEKAWVVAIDMRSKMLQGVAQFGTRSVGCAYTQCRISDHLKIAPTDTRDHLKRQGTPSVETCRKKLVTADGDNMDLQ